MNQTLFVVFCTQERKRWTIRISDATGGCRMKYTKEQRLDIGRRIYDGGLTRYEAAEEYEISDETARNYMRQYRNVNRLLPKRGTQSNCGLAKMKSKPMPAGLEDL